MQRLYDAFFLKRLNSTILEGFVQIGKMGYDKPSDDQQRVCTRSLSIFISLCNNYVVPRVHNKLYYGLLVALALYQL